MILKKIVSLLIIVFIISSASHIFAAGDVKKNYDYSNPEFKSIVDMLYMDGHSNDSISNCSVKQMYYQRVAKMYFDKGMSKNEILHYYEKELGEQALNAPKAKGFNILLWITPFLLILMVSSILYFVIKKWKKNQESTFKNEEDTTAKDKEYDMYLSKIEEERKRIL